MKDTTPEELAIALKEKIQVLRNHAEPQAGHSEFYRGSLRAYDQILELIEIVWRDKFDY